MNRGYIKLWRKISDTGILQNAEASRLLLWIFVNVSWKGCNYVAKGQLLKLAPGEKITGRKKLSKDLETDESTIRRTLELLKKMGIIDLEVTHNWTRIILVNWEKYQFEQSKVTQEQPTDDPQKTTVKEGIESKKKKKEPLSAIADDSEVLQFYKSYPNHKARQDAFKAWKQMQPPLQAVLTALAWQRKQEDWTKDGGRFVPLPASYIRGKRWEDEKPYVKDNSVPRVFAPKRMTDEERAAHFKSLGIEE